ncbi:thiamine phosphate synthase [Alkalicoccus saliphilus]|jgi:thiamine-phosphate pyrophosphorylase|uniref:Thiamine-phosphate synthase n=1 Tax=Alkalicoccus saliphilus TaxID=200989 RepID=A0A2T4U1W0_9BACI|nr:thiamine phosphate synthase [Alkalicoccus saliphilus]PTL37391.1 thiamine phosphate synthase [Alkalicoccus saliphilus]
MTGSFSREQLSLYFIAGTQDTSRDFFQVLTEALEGGVTMFQLREKGEKSVQSEEERLHLALKAKEVCSRFKVPFIVNDDAELAVKSGADGLHVGQEDLRASEARKIIGSSAVLGVSAYTIEEAAEAVEAGADYVGVGPMYATFSKQDAKAVVGPERITQMRESGINIPIVAIGGIQPEHTKAILQSGADGISVISAIASSQSPRKAAADFRSQLI